MRIGDKLKEGVKSLGLWIYSVKVVIFRIILNEGEKILVVNFKVWYFFIFYRFIIIILVKIIKDIVI